MRKVSGRTGLFWPDVLAAMESDAWREPVEANRESMMASGSWGVPTLRMGEFIARIGWPQFFKLTGIEFSKEHIDDFRHAGLTYKRSAQLRHV